MNKQPPFPPFEKPIHMGGVFRGLPTQTTFIKWTTKSPKESTLDYFLRLEYLFSLTSQYDDDAYRELSFFIRDNNYPGKPYLHKSHPNVINLLEQLRWFHKLQLGQSSSPTETFWDFLVSKEHGIRVIKTKLFYDLSPENIRKTVLTFTKLPLYCFLTRDQIDYQAISDRLSVKKSPGRPRKTPKTLTTPTTHLSTTEPSEALAAIYRAIPNIEDLLPVFQSAQQLLDYIQPVVPITELPEELLELHIKLSSPSTF